MHDSDAWEKYPHHREWFDKLRFSLRMGHRCGPCGVAPDEDGYYIVRPIYNLAGMGIGASRKFIKAGDLTCVPAGYFWCEWFDGSHISTTYKYDRDRWEPLSSWRGFNDTSNLSRFERWERSADHPHLDDFHELADVGIINVEFIGGKPIEVHLRPSGDPEHGETIIPIWADEEIDHNRTIVYDFDDADGMLDVPRIGFYIE